MSASERGPDRRRLAIGAVAVGSAIIAAWLAGLEPARLADHRGVAAIAELGRALIAPDLSASFLRRIGALAVESVLIGALGIALALLGGGGLALVAARHPGLDDDPLDRPWPRRGRAVMRSAARGLLAALRAVPEIVWAFLFVRIFGLGPGPAVLAIGLSFGGIIGKLYAELIEAADPAAARQRRAAGAGRVAVFVYGVLPEVRRPWTAYALFRLECAIRSASILGVVGAGGLGQEIELSLRYFQYDKLATALYAVLAYVVALELISLWLRRRPARYALLALGAGAGAGLLGLAIPWRELASAEALAQTGAFLAGFAPPTAEPAFLVAALKLAIATVAMAWAATALAAPLAFALAPLAATTFTIGGYLHDAPRRGGLAQLGRGAGLAVARAVLQLTRALPELVWALIFVLWVGPGPTAGVLALAVHTVGILGRLYGDALEDVEPEPPRALEAAGASALARYLHGVLPQVAARLAAFTLFRFEVNLRSAAMVGFVGAGGLGDAIHTAISLFHTRDLATLLLVLFAAIALADGAGDRLRARLAGR